jgi:hypothetical protein
MKTNTPKKLKQHLLNFLRITGVYIAIMSGFSAAHLLMGLITESDEYQKVGYAVTLIYFAISVWFCWRFYTGVYRDGDLLD